MFNKKEKQASQVKNNQTLDPYLHLLPTAVDPSEIASELVRGGSQLLKDDLLNLSPTLGSVAMTIWHLINNHNVKPEEIVIVTSSSKYKEKISEELSKYSGTAGVKLLDVYDLERAVSESALQSKIVPQWLPAFIAMTDLPLMEESEKVKTALDFSEFLNLLLNKGVDLKEKGFDAVEISKAIKEHLKKEGDKRAYLFGYGRQKALNEKDIDLLVNIFQKFIRDYYTLKNQLGYVDIQDLAHSKQGKSIFDGKRFIFALNVSDMTTMQQELIKVQAEKAGVESYFLLASKTSLYDFKGADPGLKAFKGNNLDFYLNFKETKLKHYVPPNKPKMKKEDVEWNKLSSAAIYFAKQENFAEQETVAIVTENNYQIEEINRILISQGLEYNIYITLKPNKEALNIIAQAFEKIFESKVPKPEDTELLFKLLTLRFLNDGIAIKTLNTAEQNINQFWELYEKESFQRFLADKKVDLKQALIYAALTSNFYELFIKSGNNKNIVATIYQLPMEKFDKIVYISSGAKGQLSATSSLEEEIRRLYHIQQMDEEQKRQDTLKVLENMTGEVIIITGTSKAKSRPEIPPSKDLIKGEEFEIINTSDFVFNYFNNLRVVSFSMLKDIENPAEFLVREILGYEEYSEPVEIGSKMHEIFMRSNENKLSKEEREALERKDDIVFLSNKEKIDDIIKREGYKYVPGSAERNIEIEFNELTKVLGLNKIPKTLKGKGVLDAIFEKQEENKTKYLIIDYKTGASKDYEGEHAAQLLFYKLLFSLKNNIPIKNIETAVAYVGLRSTLDDKSAATYELHWITPKEEANAKGFLRECVNDLTAYISNPQAFTKELPIKSIRDRLDSLKAFFDVYRKGTP